MLMHIMNGDIGCTIPDLHVIVSASKGMPSPPKKQQEDVASKYSEAAPEVWAYLGGRVYAEEKGKETGVFRPLQPHPLVVMRCLRAHETV